MSDILKRKINLFLASNANGRQRWQSRHLVGRPVLASRFGMLISSHDSLQLVDVSDKTGRILLANVSLPVSDVEDFLRAGLYRLLNDFLRPSSETALVVSREQAPSAPAKGAFRELIEIFPPKKRELTQATSLSFANTVVNFAPELVLIGIVNVVNGQKFSLLTRIGLGTMRTQVLALGILAGAAFAFELYIERWRRRKWRNMARKVEHNIRLETYDHLQRTDMAHIDRKGTAEQVSLLWDSTTKVRNFLEAGADDMLQRVITAVIIVVTLLAVSPALALATIAPLPIIALGSRFVAKRVEKPYEQLAGSEDVLQKFLSTNLSDLSAIKSFTAEDRESERLRELSEDMRKVSSSAIETSSRYTDLMRLLISVSFALAMTIGGFLTARKAISPALFTLVLFFVPKLLVRMESMGGGYDQYKLANHAARSILDELGVESRILSGPRRIEQEGLRGEIVFKDVDFGYREDHLILEDFSLEIPAKSNIAFVGATGSGKSTVVKLISRFYDPSAGALMLDGVDLRDLDLEDLRQAVGVVSQEGFLFDDSVYENIRFGRTDATRDEIIEAAKLAEAHSFITALPQGYDTPIGERGKQLSGGQRQRISIARAILKNAPILVFDEATSAVDNETEAAIQRSIDRFTRDRTAILIAHRLSTVRNVDCIHVMADGRIVESGTHEELLAFNGSYAALWRVQTGEATHAA